MPSTSRLSAQAGVAGSATGPALAPASFAGLAVQRPGRVCRSGAFCLRLRVVLRTTAWLAALASVLTGCGPASPKTFGTGITGYNFTGEGVQRYFVEGQYGSNLPPYGGGGKTSCCVVLPAKWTPQLKVRVDWTTGDWKVPYEQIAHLSTKEQMACCWTQRTLSKTVPIQPYEKDDGIVQVFFLPNDEIEVWVYGAGPQNPAHPSKRGYPKSPDPKP